jgi:carbohydrate-binding DOMON domain-containing protein
MIASWLALASLVLSDPVGDASGDGMLVPPTAAVYADLGELDLGEVQVDTGSPAYVRIQLASISNAADLPAGMTLPVIDIYLDLAAGGETQSLPGPSLTFAEGAGWEWALRVHGDGAVGVTNDGSPFDVAVQTVGNDIWLQVNRPLDRRPRSVAVVVGLYDPFAQDNWRGLQSRPSAWAFSGPAERPPVVDLLAPSQSEQARALQAREAYAAGAQDGSNVWWVVMWTGVTLLVASLLARRLRPDLMKLSASPNLPLLGEDDLNDEADETQH